MSPKVLFTGTYCSLNNGEMAMVLGAVNGISDIFPHSEFMVLSSFPTLDRYRYEEHNLKVVGRAKGKNWLDGLVINIRNLLKCLIFCLFSRILSKRIPWKNNLIQAYYDADIVVDVSGHSFRGAGGECSLYITLQTLLSLVYSKIFGKKFIFCAQSVNPPLSWNCNVFARIVMSLADEITVREINTFEYLNKMKINTRIHLTADLGYLLKPKYSSRVKKIFKNVKNHAKPIIGIVPRKKILKQFVDQENNLSPLASYFADLAEKIINLGGIPIFVPQWMVYGDLNDIAFIQQIKDEITNESDVFFVTEELRADELKSLLGKCDIVITMSLHAAIAAVQMKVPTIIIGFSEKFRAVEGHYIDLRNYINRDLRPSLITDILRFLNNLKMKRDELKETADIYVDNSRKNIQIIAYHLTH